MKKLMFIILLIAFSACEKQLQSTLEQNIDIPYESMSKFKISSGNNSITPEDAAKVAQLSILTRQTSTKRSDKTIKNIETICNNAGDTLIYVVNYNNNQGYTIISATKDYYPILAQIDKGNYCEDINNTGLSVIMNEYVNNINHINSIHTDTIAKMRNMWKAYETNSRSIESATKLNEFETFIVNSLQYWNENSHDFYPLEAAYGRIPDNVYQYFCSVAQGSAHPEYDYFTYSYIVETADYVDFNYNDYMLTTIWNQTAPYNNSVTEYDILSIRQSVGCGAVALGQIMRFHEWPSIFSWNNMPNSLPIYMDDTTTISNFLATIAQDIRISNEPINSSSSENTKNALRNKYNYSCSDIEKHNRSNVINSLNHSKPVFMRGRQANTESGHSWVCDGYGYTKSTMNYTLYIIETSHDLRYVPACDPYKENLSEAHYFHFNWGYGGTYNGWYVDGPNATTVPQPYTTDRKNIVNITPLNN